MDEGERARTYAKERIEEYKEMKATTINFLIQWLHDLKTENPKATKTINADFEATGSASGDKRSNLIDTNLEILPFTPSTIKRRLTIAISP